MLLPAIAPDWLPDETLYSLCARIRHLSCSATSTDTTRMLFGAARTGFQHDFPTGLSALVERSEGRWGSVNELIDQHTILPYFLPFRSSENAANAYAAMTGKAEGMLKYQLGLLTSRFRAHHPLKACPRCMALDREEHQVAYWHLSHQYPGVLTCIEHGVTLLESMIKATGVQRFGWILPGDGTFREQYRCLALFEGELPERLQRLTTDSIQLARLPRGFHFDLPSVSETYRRQARVRGYLHASRFAWDPMSRDYLGHISPLHAIEPLSGLPGDLAQSRRDLERLLRTPRAGTHPIRHLALINWLFDDWSGFLGAYEAVVTEPNPSRIASAVTNAPLIDHRMAPFLSIMQTEGPSLSKAARMVGVDIGTAMAWAAKHGISVNRRAKVLRPMRRAELEAALRSGADKASASKQFGVSVTTITTTLRTTPGLYLAWQDARARLHREQRRHEWQQVIKQNQGTYLKMLRRLAPACYAWLYRNDRAWLDEANAHLPAGRSGNHSPIVWDKRDRQLAAAVERLGDTLAVEFSGKPIPLGRLCQQLPELKAKIGHLERLPLTEQALSILVRRRQVRSTRSSPLI